MNLEYWAVAPRSEPHWQWVEPVCRAIVWITVGCIGLALLESLFVPRFGSRPGDAKISAAKADISNLAAALEEYKTDYGSYPSTEQGLEALVEQPVGVGAWQRGYSDKIPTDPWGHRYIYIEAGPDGKPFDLLSYGPDGQPGGGDDISN